MLIVAKSRERCLRREGPVVSFNVCLLHLDELWKLQWAIMGSTERMFGCDTRFECDIRGSKLLAHLIKVYIDIRFISISLSISSLALWAVQAARLLRPS